MVMRSGFFSSALRLDSPSMDGYAPAEGDVPHHVVSGHRPAALGYAHGDVAHAPHLNAQLSGGVARPGLLGRRLNNGQRGGGGLALGVKGMDDPGHHVLRT